MEPAPLFDDIEGTPEDGRAFWAVASDGVRIRVALWQPQGGGSSTVLIFPGRTEYIEKYVRVVQGFLDRGHAVAVIDWRGQGLADRHPTKPRLGHVTAMSNYQLDLAAMLGVVDQAGLPTPSVMVGHSMGGGIGLRALLNGLAVEHAIFTAPMWGFHILPMLRPVAVGMSETARMIGLGDTYMLTTKDEDYVLVAGFEGNTLTGDEPTWNWLGKHLRAHPELGLGGPSNRWFCLARAEVNALVREAPAPHKCLTFLGTQEQITDPGAIRKVMAKWPNGKLVEVEGAQHEIMMETPQRVAQFWAHVDTFLAT